MVEWVASFIYLQNGREFEIEFFLSEAKKRSTLRWLMSHRLKHYKHRIDIPIAEGLP